MNPLPDGFDQGAEEIWAARSRGEKLLKPDVARIMRTTVQAYNLSHPSTEPTNHAVAEVKKKKHPLSAALSKALRDSLFDAFVAFEAVTPNQITANGRYKITEAIEQILAVCPELSPEEIKRRGATYKKLFHNVTPTSMGLCGKWAVCGGGPQPKAERLDPYTEPPNWKETALRMYPGTEVPDLAWLNIPITLRADILAKLPK